MPIQQIKPSKIGLPPTSSTVTKFMLKPIKTMLACRIFLELKRIPFSSHVGRRKKARIMPKRMAKTALPTTGTSCPKNQDGNAMTMQRHSPGKVFFSYKPMLLQGDLRCFSVAGTTNSSSVSGNFFSSMVSPARCLPYTLKRNKTTSPSLMT